MENLVIRTPRKSTKVSYCVEVALERSKYVNATENSKHRKMVIKDSQQNVTIDH